MHEENEMSDGMMRKWQGISMKDEQMCMTR